MHSRMSPQRRPRRFFAGRTVKSTPRGADMSCLARLVIATIRVRVVIPDADDRLLVGFPALTFLVVRRFVMLPKNRECVRHSCPHSAMSRREFPQFDSIVAVRRIAPVLADLDDDGPSRWVYGEPRPIAHLRRRPRGPLISDSLR